MADQVITPENEAPAEAQAPAERWRCGDHVLHACGETWVVAFADHEQNDIAACGWPNTLARISDCERVKIATDAGFLRIYDALASTGDNRTTASGRLYAEEAEAVRARLAGAADDTAVSRVEA